MRVFRRQAVVVLVSSILMFLGEAGAQSEASESIGTHPTIPLSSIQVANSVSECLELKLNRISKCGSVTRLFASGRFLKSVATCGCRSRRLSYRVMEEIVVPPDGTTQYERAAGLVLASAAGQTKQFEFVLSSDNAIQYDGPIILGLECALPD